MTQSNLEFRIPPAPASWGLGFQVHSTTPSWGVLSSSLHVAVNFFVDPVVKVSGSVPAEVLWCEIGRRLNEVLIPAFPSRSVRLVLSWVHPCTWHNLMLWSFIYFSYAYVPKVDTFWNTMPPNLHLLLPTTPIRTALEVLGSCQVHSGRAIFKSLKFQFKL